MAIETVTTSPALVEQAPAPSPARGATSRLQEPRVVLAIALGILLVSLFLNSFRAMEAIDMNSDEATYAIESVALQQTGMTKWNGAPFLVHPPLYFLIEGLYFKVR